MPTPKDEKRIKCIDFAIRIVEGDKSGFSGGVEEIAEAIVEAAKKIEEYIDN